MWAANADVLVTDLGDELVLMHPAHSQMYSLNMAGRQVWQWLPGPLEELASKLAETYSLDPKVALNDVQEVLNDLLVRDLVQVTSG